VLLQNVYFKVKHIPKCGKAWCRVCFRVIQALTGGVHIRMWCVSPPEAFTRKALLDPAIALEFRVMQERIRAL
jgi:hypothetical protein